MTEELDIIDPVPHGDLCLRFADEAEAFSALYKEASKVTTVTDEEGNTSTLEEPIPGEFVARYSMAIDTIGVIHQTIGDMDAEGNFLTAPLPGWHVNTRGEMPEELLQYAVTPEQPVRVWA